MAREVARRGAFISFDRVTLEGILPDAKRIRMIMSLVEAGCAEQLLLSSDFFQEMALKKHRGPGLAQTVTVFGPKLVEAGPPGCHAAAHPGRQSQEISRLHAQSVIGRATHRSWA